MARRGLNCTMSYPRGGNTRAFRIRVGRIQSGFEMIASESAARATKAYYPRQTAPTQFAIQPLLIGYEEKVAFNGWLMRYVNFLLDPGRAGKVPPQITVTIPRRNFKRVGVPVEGFEFGDHLASMVWTPNLVFETSREPIDWSDTFKTSRVLSGLSSAKSAESEYFYPTGTQLSGDASPAGSYDTLLSAVNPSRPTPGRSLGERDDEYNAEN